MYEGFAEFGRMLEKNSGGRLKVKTEAAGAIVPAAKEFDGVDGGLIQFASGAASYWRDKFNAAGLFTFTVAGLSPMESLYWWKQGGGKELLHEMIAGHDVKVFQGQITPPEIFLQSTKPLESPEDIKGLKIRTAGDDGEIFNAMGASTVFLPGGEIYEALQRGVIDAAQISTPSIDWTLAMQEVADYLYLSGVRQPMDWSLNFMPLSMYEELPDDLKEVIEATADQNTMWFYGWMMEQDLVAMQNFIDYGTNIAPAAPSIVEELARQAKIFYEDKAAEDPFFDKVINSIWDFQATYRNTWERL
jgi:TRAP-type mannitol/chloroaromatic compound transport system substrate-binding protein